MFTLHDYQQAFYDKICSAWLNVRVALGVLPTGGGKTVVFSQLIHDLGDHCLVVAHRREIMTQISLSLARFGVKHRVIAPDKTVRVIRRKHYRILGSSFIDRYASIGVGSVQTLTTKSMSNNTVMQQWLDSVRHCVFDEAHHYIAKGMWGRAVDRMAHAKLLLVTASPERADGVGLGLGQGGYAEVMVEGPTVRDLMQWGHLSNYRYKAPASDLQVDDIPLDARGEFNAKALKARVTESHIVGDAVSQYQTHGEGRRAIVFATDVATAHDMATAFAGAGINAAALDGTTDDGVRENTLEAFEAGSIQVLVNVDLFDEGFDVPAVECVVMARPTMSLAKFLQQIGRSLRVAEGKKDAIIIDLVRNWERHGMPSWPRKWTLEGTRGERSGRTRLPPQRLCLKCTHPYDAFHKVCPFCGHEPKPAERSKPEQVNGDLVELDTAAMDALFSRIAAANKSVEDYRSELFARNIPTIGHPRMIKKHKATLYRRGVLEQQVKWWVGVQQQLGRTMSEIYRRFYCRFGVDMGTALALDQQTTDALIERIKTQFTEDIIP